MVSGVPVPGCPSLPAACFALCGPRNWKLNPGPLLTAGLGCRRPNVPSSAVCECPPCAFFGVFFLPSPRRASLQTPPPELSKIPERDRLGVTAMLLTCAYRGAEFFRVGYYVNNELATPPVADAEGGMDDEVPPPTDPNLLIRNILVDQPRVTRFSINWE